MHPFFIALYAAGVISVLMSIQVTLDSVRQELRRFVNLYEKDVTRDQHRES